MQMVQGKEKAATPQKRHDGQNCLKPNFGRYRTCAGSFRTPFEIPNFQRIAC